jgi:LCP family protein required for cell wall assembly
MATGPLAKTRPQDRLLEKQLEQLFSDFMTLEATPPTRLPANLSTPGRLLQPRWLPKSRWIVNFLGALIIVGLTSALMLSMNQVKPAKSSAIATPPRAENAVAANPILTTANPTAPVAASTTPKPASATPTIAASATSSSVVKSSFVVSVTPSSTKSTATHTPPPTATHTPTAIPTATPTAPTATPTLAPVLHVNPATATPVAAEAIGLDAIPTPVARVPMPEKAINIVLLGSDQRPYETSYWRTDVVIVVSINPDLPSVSMLSIPRDTWLYIPNWTYQRINLADTHGAAVSYPGGGPGLVKAAIEYNFGIHVDYFARVDFAGLMHLVDTLGGVDVLLDCPVEDGFPDDPITEDPSVVTQISYPVPGLYHLDGKRALWLARSRKTTSEFARSRRQHRILQGMWAKANQLGFITRLPELWEDLNATVETDLSLDNVLWLASLGLQLEPSQIRSDFIDGRYLTAWVSPGGANVLLPHTEDILEALEPLFNPYPYKAPQGFSRIEVWNGSGHENWGLLAADKLLRNGFEIAEVRQADKLYEDSTILDFTNDPKGSPLPLLQRLFNADVVHPADGEVGSGTPFRLIVGATYQPCQWPTLARWNPTPTPTAAAPEN